MHNPNFGGFDDYGLTIDTAFAIQAVGGNDGVVRQIRDAMAAASISTPPTSTSATRGRVRRRHREGPRLRPGARAPTRARTAGINLVAQTEGRVSRRARSPVTAEDVRRLRQRLRAGLRRRGADRGRLAEGGQRDVVPAQQQCTSGFFRLELHRDKDAAQQGCVEGTATTARPTSTSRLWPCCSWSRSRQKNATRTAASARRPPGSRPPSAPTARSAAERRHPDVQRQQHRPGRLGAWPARATAWPPAARAAVGAEAAGPQPGRRNAAGRRGRRDRLRPARPRRREVSGITDATEDQWRRADHAGRPAARRALTSAT